MKLHIYENGSDEEFLKIIKEFKNYVDLTIFGALEIRMLLIPSIKISADASQKPLEFAGV
jgi:hypothetical protein